MLGPGSCTGCWTRASRCNSRVEYSPQDAPSSSGATGTWVDMMFSSLVSAAFCTLAEPALAYWASAAWAAA